MKIQLTDFALSVCRNNQVDRRKDGQMKGRKNEMMNRQRDEQETDEMTDIDR